MLLLILNGLVGIALLQYGPYADKHAVAEVNVGLFLQTILDDSINFDVLVAIIESDTNLARRPM